MKNNFPTEGTFQDTIRDIEEDVDELVALDRQKTSLIRHLIAALISVSVVVGGGLGFLLAKCIYAP